MAWTIEQLKGYVRYHDEAVRMLDDAGLEHKTIKGISFCCLEGTAFWKGISETEGYIVIYEGCEIGCVAHEVGHSLHESKWIRSGLGGDSFGEEYADAIRWFASGIVRKASDASEFDDGWYDKYDKGKNNILTWCNENWEDFVRKLKAKQFCP